MALGKFMAASVLLFMCTAGISVSAAPFSIQRLEDRINSSEISFSYIYSVSGGKVSMTGQGSAVLQGDAYILDVDGMEVYCDGTARWTLDRKAEELVVESCDTYPVSLSANPVLLLLLPLLGGLMGYRAVVYVRRGSVPTARWETLVWSGMAVVLVIWGIWRNI